MHRLTHEQVYIDTNIFIAAIEAFNRIALEFFRRAEEGLIFALTSEIARGELIVKPIMAGNSALIQRYNHLLDGNHGVSTLAVDSEIVSEAARLSATTGLELVDAPQRI
ncbi:MAG: PIN domain-containing protein, partial [Pseudomonadota bacterium]